MPHCFGCSAHLLLDINSRGAGDTGPGHQHTLLVMLLLVLPAPTVVLFASGAVSTAAAALLRQWRRRHSAWTSAHSHAYSKRLLPAVLCHTWQVLDFLTACLAACLHRVADQEKMQGLDMKRLLPVCK
jgi:hypothetical protein